MTIVVRGLNPLAILPALAILCGCGGQSTGNSLPSGLPTVETVNGQAVPQILLDVLARERNLDLSVAEQRAKALTELTDYVLLSQAADAGGFAKDTEFAAEVEINRLRGVANATVAKFRSSAQVDDTVLKTEYDRQIGLAGRSEYDFSQLLFDNEDDALKAAGEAMSKPFNEVYDAWAPKARQARAFQRVRPSQLPENLGKVLVSLKSGETAKLPVQTNFGWHVIHVGAISPFVPPPFEELKESIRETLLGQLADQRLAKLRSEANVVTETPADAPTGASTKPTDAPSN